MNKKLYESYPQGKQQKKNKQSILKTEKLPKTTKSLPNRSDDEIDFSDIPELDFDKLGKLVVGKFYRPIKKPISIRMDSDVDLGSRIVLTFREAGPE